MFGFDPYSPRATYNSAPMRGSYYDTNPFAPAYTRDHLARNRYVRALQEQQAARQAYADALAQREVQRLEDEYATDPYSRAVPRSASQYLTGDNDDEDDDYNERLRSAYIMQQKAQQQAALERRREQQLLAGRERQATLDAEAARRAAIEARRARQHAQYEAEQRALEEERLRRGQRYYNQHPAQSQQPQPAAVQEPTAVRVPIRASTPPASSTPVPAQSDSESPALEAISKISSAASDLRKTFQLPPSIDFVDSADKPTLSYASTNRPIRAYEDAMSKLLEKLDAVESAGVTEIREARRQVVKEIEGALQELEGQVEGIWRKEHMQDMKEASSASTEAPLPGDQDETDAMTLDGESVGQSDTTFDAASSTEPSSTTPTTEMTEMTSEPPAAPRQELFSSVPDKAIEATGLLTETVSHSEDNSVSHGSETATSVALPEAAKGVTSGAGEGQQQPQAAAQRDPWSAFDIIV